MLITTAQAAEILGCTPDAARQRLSRWAKTGVVNRRGMTDDGQRQWSEPEIRAAIDSPETSPGRGARTDLIRVQIQYHTGPGDRPTAWGWLTLDGQRPPADETKRRDWARRKVADDIHQDAADVKILAVHVGTVCTLADVDRYGP